MLFGRANSNYNEKVKKVYQNQKIRVYYDKDICRHSGNCIFGLPEVFDVDRKPWVDVDAAQPDEIKRCIENCPSGALSCELLQKED
jgi:uncharacterized Fe-S cluster protein YjdI